MQIPKTYSGYLKANKVTVADVESGLVRGLMNRTEFAKFVHGQGGQINDLNKSLESANQAWYNGLMRGDDDKNPDSMAYHARMNARRLVYMIEEIESQ